MMRIEYYCAGVLCSEFPFTILKQVALCFECDNRKNFVIINIFANSLVCRNTVGLQKSLSVHIGRELEKVVKIGL